jgi:hypothetical protein
MGEEKGPFFLRPFFLALFRSPIFSNPAPFVQKSPGIINIKRYHAIRGSESPRCAVNKVQLCRRKIVNKKSSFQET